MHPVDIKRSMLPMWQIEIYNEVRGWFVFTDQPFESREAAEAHRQLMMKHYAVGEDRIRVAEYTSKEWQRDLIDLVMKDEDAIRRCLSCLRSELLLLSLRETDETEMEPK